MKHCNPKSQRTQGIPDRINTNVIFCVCFRQVQRTLGIRGSLYPACQKLDKGCSPLRENKIWVPGERKKKKELNCQIGMYLSIFIVFLLCARPFFSMLCHLIHTTLSLTLQMKDLRLGFAACSRS